MSIGIALFTYRRPWHTQQVLESLKRNAIDKLYIFQDGLRDERDREDWQKVSDLIRGVDFVPTEIFISDINRGLANSIISGVDYVFSKHDMAIALEDDIRLSSQYISFMHECFCRYRDNPEVSCVAGGGWAIELPNSSYDAFFSLRMSSIAWGTWKDRWQQYDRDYTLLARILHDPEKKKILNQCGTDIETIMRAQLLGECDSWALFWTLMQINNKQVCVLPTQYLAQDIGHDGVKGTNSVTATTRFDTVLHDGGKRGWNLPNQVTVDSKVMGQIGRVLNMPLPEKRLDSYYSITRQWIECLQKRFSFGDYFAQRGISSVYIYDAADMGRLMFEQIKDLVEVKGFLEYHKSRMEFCGCKVFDFSDDLVLGKAYVLVTPVHDWDYIVYSIEKRFGMQNFIHLKAMLDEIRGKD